MNRSPISITLYSTSQSFGFRNHCGRGAKTTKFVSQSKTVLRNKGNIFARLLYFSKKQKYEANNFQYSKQLSQAWLRTVKTRNKTHMIKV